MLTRAAFGLVIVLASVSGALAAPRTHASPRGQAVVNTQTVHNPSAANGSRSHSESAPTIWGWPQDPAYRR